MQVTRLTDDTLRSLSELEAGEPVVVRLFLNLDPAQFATARARASQISSLLSDLEALLPEGDMSSDAAKALKVDRERIEAILRDDDLDVDEAAALRRTRVGSREVRRLYARGSTALQIVT